MISKRTKYALKAVLHLGKRYGQGPILISEIVEAERVPQKFLEAILLDLKKLGFLVSKQGKGGGYQLATHPSEIRMGDLMRALEGPIALVPCVSQTAYHECEECPDQVTCGVRLLFKDVRDRMVEILDGTTVSNVLDRMQAEGQKVRAVPNWDI